jgi:hypothetical protein
LIFLEASILLCSISNNYKKYFIVGWNTWDYYRYEINEKTIRDSVDIIVSTGLAALGYEYSLF